MSILNYDMVIENISILMKKHGINQKKLADEIGISQPNLSKALSSKDKKRLTLDQIVDIADYFNVSVDFLLGRVNETKNYTPSIENFCRMFMGLYENEIIKLKEIEIEENVFEYDFTKDYGPPYSETNQKNQYISFYFSNYSNPDTTNMSLGDETNLYDYFSNFGNYSSQNNKINNFISFYLKLYDLYKQNNLSREIFDTAINDRLKSME